MEPDVENNCELFTGTGEETTIIENLRLKEQLWLVKNTGLKRFFMPYMFYIVVEYTIILLSILRKTTQTIYQSLSFLDKVGKKIFGNFTYKIK